MIYTVSVRSREFQPSNVVSTSISNHRMPTGVMDMSINVEANSIPEALDKARDLLAITEEKVEREQV